MKDLQMLRSFILYTKDEIKQIKDNLSKEDIEWLKNELGSVLVDYEELKKSVIYTKGDLTNIDKNDYVSLATYWWPNPDTVDHLPYIRRDGHRTYEDDMYDKLNFRVLGYDMYMLSLLYYITEDIVYYNALKKNVTYYLLDSVTGMNPNLNHGQMIRGINDGRCIGIIDYSTGVAPGFYMVKLISDLGLVDNEFKSSLDIWIKDFLDWMLYSPLGIEESNTLNNHAVYYDFGSVVLADFINDEKTVKLLYDNMINRRIPLQIEADGSMPLELERTKSKHYSIMNLRGICHFSIITQNYGYSIWDNEECNALMINAIDYIFDRIIFNTKVWEYDEIDDICGTYLNALMNEAVKHISDKYYIYDKLQYVMDDNKVFKLLGDKLFNKE